MSTIRVRSPASYRLAVPAAAWMLGVVVVPIVLLVCGVALGRPRFLAGEPAHLRQLRPVLRQPDLPQAGGEHLGLHTATLMTVTGVLGYCIAYFLVMKVRSPCWRLASCSWPSSSRSGPHADPRHRLGPVPRRQRRHQPAPDVHRRHAARRSRRSSTRRPASPWPRCRSTPCWRPGGVYMLNYGRAAAARGGDDPEGDAAHRVLAHRLPAHPARRRDRPGAGVPQRHVRLRRPWPRSAATSTRCSPTSCCCSTRGSQHRAASVVAVLLMICMLVGVVIALRVVDIRRLGADR